MQMSNHQLFYDAVCRMWCVLLDDFFLTLSVSKDEICRRTDDNFHNLHQLWKLVEKVNTVKLKEEVFCFLDGGAASKEPSP